LLQRINKKDLNFHCSFELFFIGRLSLEDEIIEWHMCKVTRIYVSKGAVDFINLMSVFC